MRMHQIKGEYRSILMTLMMMLCHIHLLQHLHSALRRLHLVTTHLLFVMQLLLHLLHLQCALTHLLHLHKLLHLHLHNSFLQLQA